MFHRYSRKKPFSAGLANSDTLPTHSYLYIEELSKHIYTPTITYDGKKEVFYMLPLAHIQGEAKTFSSLSIMLDRYYFGKAERDRVKQQGHDLERFIQMK